MSQPTPKRTGTWTWVSAGLLFLIWVVGTPMLAWVAAMTATPFFGEQPSPEEMRTANTALAGAIACGFAAPAAGLVIGFRSRRPWLVSLFTAALVITGAAAVWLTTAVS